MPLYDFECPHGHRFEYLCSITDRHKEIPCEGKVNQMVDDELEAIHDQDPSIPLPPDHKWVVMEIGVDMAEGQKPIVESTSQRFLVKRVPCILKAKLIVGPHSNPAGMIDHGLARNRDAAREGRYDPNNPSKRFISKGRSWRK